MTKLALPVLYSAADAQATFPASHRPLLRIIKANAREAVHCRILGKAMARVWDSVPVELRIYRIMPGDREGERAPHARFSTHRLRSEWFRLEGDLADWLAAIEDKDEAA